MSSSDIDSASLPELLSRASSSSSSLDESSAAEYLEHLTSLSLDSLRSEPSTLSSTSAQLTNALTTLCHTSYPTFLSLHSASSSLGTSLTSLSSSLSNLLTALPALQASAKAFSTSAQPIIAQRRHALVLRDHAAKLSDVLALPKLIDACVRNGAHNDALDLAAHARSLAAKYSDVPLMRDVAAECEAAEHALKAQLLGTLREPGRARLPALFRAVGLLRRMQALPEQALALAFLTGRLGALDAALGALEVDRRAADAGDGEARARFIRKWVDTWREGVHDAVTHYSTIFLERGTSTPLPSSSTPPAIDKDDITQLHVLLTTFCTSQLTRLLTLLDTHVPALRAHDPSAPPALLTQLSYCGSSFARVGLDFRALLAPIFLSSASQGFQTDLASALSSFVGTIDGYQKRRVKPSDWVCVPAARANPPEGDPAAVKREKANVPPRVLGAYPPLTKFANGVLEALNALRVLAPREALPPALRAMDGVLADAAHAFLEYAKEAVREGQGKNGGEEGERVLKAAGKVLVRVWIPFARRALVEGVFGVVVDKEVGPKLTKASGESADRLRGAMKEWEEWFGEEDDDEDEEGDEEGDEDEEDEEEAGEDKE